MNTPLGEIFKKLFPLHSLPPHCLLEIINKNNWNLNQGDGGDGGNPKIENHLRGKKAYGRLSILFKNYSKMNNFCILPNTHHHRPSSSPPRPLLLKI